MVCDFHLFWLTKSYIAPCDNEQCNQLPGEGRIEGRQRSLRGGELHSQPRALSVPRPRTSATHSSLGRLSLLAPESHSSERVALANGSSSVNRHDALDDSHERCRGLINGVTLVVDGADRSETDTTTPTRSRLTSKGSQPVERHMTECTTILKLSTQLSRHTTVT